MNLLLPRPKGDKDAEGLTKQIPAIDDASILAAADEASDALAELQDGPGQAAVHEGVASVLLDVFQTGLGEGWSGTAKGRREMMALLRALPGTST